MQLKKGVCLTLIPIISALVIALSLAIWTFIFEQTKRSEIDRARLAIEMALVDVRHSATELSSALNRVAEYDNIFSADSNTEEDLTRFALNRSFVEFSYLLSSQIPGIREVMLLDADLKLLALASSDGLLAYEPFQPGLDSVVWDNINQLHDYLHSRLQTQGVISYENEGEAQLLAARVFSPDTREDSNRIWSNNRFIVAATATAVARPPHQLVSNFSITPNGATALQDITNTPILVSEASSDATTYLFSDSALFRVGIQVADREIFAQMSNFTLTLIGISLLLIASLVMTVVMIVNRQILAPIANLERKVGLSMSTGVVDLHSTEERNEVEALGNRYLELMNRVSRLANMDTLTQLPNRDQFLTSVANTLKHHPEKTFVVFYLDLDRFKQVNDFYGHAEGDRLLRSFAKELQRSVDGCLKHPGQRTALISRLAGDEFVVFAEIDMLKADPQVVAEELVRGLSRGFDTGQGTLHLEVSVGVACYPQHAETAETLVARADEAMFEAKNRGRNRWEVLSPAIVAQNDLKKVTQEAIEEALEEGQFYLVFQPIFNTHTLEPVGAEVLLRSSNKTLQEIGTQAFIEIAEISGAIRRIDALVANMAIARLAQIRESFPNFHFSINFSAAELTTPDFAETLSDAVASAGLTADAVEIEVTETRLTEFGIQALETLEKLHHNGFSVALDDFGTGYNSFAQLNSSYVSRLKIDRRFISAINTDSRDANMVNIILGTAQLYKMEAVAEGIETEEQLAHIQAHNCQYMQGFLLARPMEWDDLCEFLNKDRVTWKPD